jgi:hypothetical protein
MATIGWRPGLPSIAVDSMTSQVIDRRRRNTHRRSVTSRKETTMSNLVAATPVGRSLLVDVVLSGGFGVVLLAGGGFIAGLLGLPEALLRGAGLALLPFAAAVLWLACQTAPPPWAVKSVIAANLVWMAASLVLLTSGWISPTRLGGLFVIAQALLVAGLAAAQATALRRHAPAMAEPALRRP